MKKFICQNKNRNACSFIYRDQQVGSFQQFANQEIYNRKGLNSNLKPQDAVMVHEYRGLKFKDYFLVNISAWKYINEKI